MHVFVTGAGGFVGSVAAPRATVTRRLQRWARPSLFAIPYNPCGLYRVIAMMTDAYLCLIRQGRKS